MLRLARAGCPSTDVLLNRAILSDGKCEFGDFSSMAALHPLENGVKHRFRSRLEKGPGSKIK